MGWRMSQGTAELGASSLASPRAERSARIDAVAYGLITTMACVVIIRRLVFLVGVYAATTATAGQYDAQYTTLTPWLAFDAIHYLDILEDGYPADGIPYQIAFFPMVPLIGRVLAAAVEPAQALLLLANVATVIGFLFFYQWCRMWASARVAFWACLLLATFPGATVFAAGQTEGVFFCCTAIALWLMQRDRLWQAALVCAIATAVRPTGAALTLTLVIWALVRQVMVHRPDWRRCSAWQRIGAVLATLVRPTVIGRIIALGLIGNAGIMAYQGYLWHRYDDFNVYFKAQSYWDPNGLKNDSNRQIQESIAAQKAVEVRDWGYFAAKATTPGVWNRLMLLPLFGLMLWGLMRRNLVPRTMYLLPIGIFLLAYVPDWGLRATSIIRFESAGLPLFLLLAAVLASWRRVPLLAPLVAAQFAVQLYYAYLFSRGFWIG